MNYTNCVDQTVMCTPEPRACSTEGKPRTKFISLIPAPLNFDEDGSRKFGDESLGTSSISDVKSELDIPQLRHVNHHTLDESHAIKYKPYKKDDTNFGGTSVMNLSSKLKTQRELAHATLAKASGLPQRLIQPSQTFWQQSNGTNSLKSSESTVNESDLLKNIQTPPQIDRRQSIANMSKMPNLDDMLSLPLTGKTDMFNLDTSKQNKNITKELNDMQELVKNELSFREIFEKFKQISHSTFISDDDDDISNSKMDSNLFMPAELAKEKLLADEMSWRKEYNEIPTKRGHTSFAPLNEYTEKLSMGEFFKGKSDDCSSIFSKSSTPYHAPVALIDNTGDDSNLDETVLSEDARNYRATSDAHNNHNSSIKSNITDDSRISLAADKYSDSIAAIQNFIAGYQAESPNQIVEKLMHVMDRGQEHTNVKKSANKISFHTNSKKPNDEKNISGFNKFRDERTSLGDYSQLTNQNYLKNSKQFVSTGHLSSTQNKTDDILEHGAKLATARSLNCISESNKENHNRSLTSVRSGSSMDTLPDGKLPLACNKSELVWSCVRLGKVDNLDFMLKNKYHQKLRIQISCTNPNFKISNAEVDPMGTLTILLQPLESRKFTIYFSPTCIGAHSAKLNFYPIIKSQLQKSQRQLLCMYGYGGHSKIVLRITADGNNKLWLNFGSLDNNSVINAEFIAENVGTLPGFIHLQTVSKMLASSSRDLIRIEPKQCVLKPGEMRKIKISFKPERDDRKNIQNHFQCNINAFVFAYINCTSGSEATRARLQRIYESLIRTNSDVDALLSHLMEPFENECFEEVEDVRLCKESIASTKMLLNALEMREIKLHIMHDTDKTYIADDDTSTFHTLVNNQSNITVIDRHKVGTSHNTSNHAFTIEPQGIVLAPPVKCKDTLLITSESRADIRFEVLMQPEGIVSVDRREGIIRPGETVLLNVQCGHVESKQRQNVRVMVYAENDVSEVEIKIIKV